METGIITYNLKERGRKHRGQDRNFNVKQIADTINGNEVQERVKNRDMHGFYGHWSRIKFGMTPREGIIENGKIVNAEPAFVTTHLQANYDGTIEHKAQFLGTKSGELSYKLWKSKAGGFSSAIDTKRPDFFGFDYVLEPNYTTNRGYTFDSVCEGGMCGALLPDEIDQAIYDEQIAGTMRLLDSVQQFQDYAMQAIESLQAQQAQQQAIQQVKKQQDTPFIKPKMIPIGGYKQVILDSASRFRDDQAVERFMRSQFGLNQDQVKKSEQQATPPEIKGIMRYLGMKS